MVLITLLTEECSQTWDLGGVIARKKVSLFMICYAFISIIMVMLCIYEGAPLHDVIR